MERKKNTKKVFQFFKKGGSPLVAVKQAGASLTVGGGRASAVLVWWPLGKETQGHG